MKTFSHTFRSSNREQGIKYFKMKFVENVLKCDCFNCISNAEFLCTTDNFTMLLRELLKFNSKR